MLFELGMFTGLLAVVLGGLVGFFVFKRNPQTQKIFTIVVGLVAAVWIAFFQFSNTQDLFLVGAQNALQVGFFSGNPLSLVMFTILTPLSLLLIVLRGFSAESSDDDQAIAVIGYLWGLAGVWLALFGATVWSVLGSFPLLFLSNAFLSRSDLSMKNGSDELFKDSFHRVVAWLLLVSGVGILVGVGLQPNWGTVDLSGFNKGDVLSGLVMVFLGIVFSFKLYPFVPVAWTSDFTEFSLKKSWSRFWFPASVALLILIRFNKLFFLAGLSGVLSALSMVGSALMLTTALSQSGYEKTRDGVQSAFFMLSLSLLFDVGELGCVAAWASFIFGSMILDIVNTTEERADSTIGRVARIFGGLVLMGGPGFVGFPSMVSWYSNSINGDYGILGFKVFVGLLFLATSWKLVFLCAKFSQKKKNQIEPSLELGLAVPFCIIFALALVWWGDFIGMLFGPQEKAWAGLFKTWSGEQPLSFSISSETITAAVIHIGLLLVSALVSYWAVLARPEIIRGFSQRWPRFTVFLQTGYGVPRLEFSIGFFFRELAQLDRSVLEERVWNRFIPALVDKALHGSSFWIKEADGKISEWIRTSTNKSTQSLTRVTQLMQNGDFQWYLVFGILAGMVMILHILRG